MTVVAEHTVLPPDDPVDQVQLAQLADLVNHTESAASLVGAAGRHAPLPQPVYEVLVEVVTALRAGRAVTIAPTARRLTTQEAADLLGVSRPTLINLLDTGKIAFERPGRHRRIRIEDVIAYREQRRRERREHLQEMIRETEELGLYDDDAE